MPGLAESWDVSDDGLTVTLHLRSGVMFDDGSTFDSADVVDSFDEIKDEATAAVAAATLANVTGADAPDPSTVVLTLSAPDAGLLAGLASVNLAMLSVRRHRGGAQHHAQRDGPLRLRFAACRRSRSRSSATSTTGATRRRSARSSSG